MAITTSAAVVLAFVTGVAVIGDGILPRITVDEVIARQERAMIRFPIVFVLALATGVILALRTAERPPSVARWLAPSVTLPLLAALPLLVGASFYFPFTNDDAFIFLRYARNLGAGHGPVYNVGDRVEGYTSPLWVLLLGMLARLHVDLLAAAKVLGLLLGVGAVWCLFAAVREFGRSHVAAFVTAIALSAQQLFLSWVGSGMDVALFVAWQLLFAWALARCENEPTREATWIAAVGLWVRPEAWLVVPIAWASMFVRQPRAVLRTLPRTLTVAGSGALLIAGRLLYYHRPFPNTYYAKSFLTRDDAVQWLRLVGDYWGFGFFALALAGLCLLLRHAPWALLSAIAMLAFFFAVGGDILGIRFAAHLLPLLLLGIGRALSEVARRGVLLGPFAVATFALVLGAHGTLQMHDARATQFKSAHAHLYVASNSTSTFEADALAGMYLHAHARPTDLLLTDNIGAAGFYGGTYVLDSFGLVDRKVADLIAQRHLSEIADLVRAADPKWILANDGGSRWGIFAVGDIERWAASRYRVVQRWRSRTGWPRVLLERVS